MTTTYHRQRQNMSPQTTWSRPLAISIDCRQVLYQQQPRRNLYFAWARHISLHNTKSIVNLTQNITETWSRTWTPRTLLSPLSPSLCEVSPEMREVSKVPPSRWGTKWWKVTEALSGNDGRGGRKCRFSTKRYPISAALNLEWKQPITEVDWK